MDNVLLWLLGIWLSNGAFGSSSEIFGAIPRMALSSGWVMTLYEQRLGFDFFSTPFPLMGWANGDGVIFSRPLIVDMKGAFFVDIIVESRPSVCDLLNSPPGRTH